MNKKLLTILVLSLLTLSSCNLTGKKKSNSGASTGTPAAHKDTLSSWSLPSTLWAARLDLNGANLSGTPFTMVFKFADNGEVTCTGTVLAGSEANGTYDNTACSVSSASPQATTTGSAPFKTGAGGGTYANDGTNFTLCRATSSCFTYQ